MTKGQRAMAVAMIQPATNQGKKTSSKLEEVTGYSAASISRARTILKWAPELADGVLRGAEHLDKSYGIAADPKRQAAA